MEISASHRRQIRLLEKQLRPEVIERCLQFLDILINQIIYQENIYPSDFFTPCQMYRTLVYQSIDKDLSSYITLCVASLRDLFSQQLSDMISINIIRNCQMPIILRRYLVELHTIQDPCLRAIYDNTKQLIDQLDQTFAQCIQTIQRIEPLENQHSNKSWTFQLRSSSEGRNNKGLTIGEILRQKAIYKEFILINQQSDLLSHGKQSSISTIKSLHSERLKLQFMCEEDKYEQDKFQQWNHNADMEQQQTDSDTDELQEDLDETNMSLDSKISNESELWPLTTVNNPPLCAINEEEENFTNDEEKSDEKKTKRRKKKKKLIHIDSDVLIDRYRSTQKIDRDHLDALQNSSDDDIQPQSPHNHWNDEDVEEDEDL